MFVNRRLGSLSDCLQISTNGFLSGKALPGTQGIKRLKLIAKDDFGSSASKDITINIKNSNPKTLVSPLDQETFIGREFRMISPDNLFVDDDGDLLTLKPLLENGFKIMDWLLFDEKKNLL